MRVGGLARGVGASEMYGAGGTASRARGLVRVEHRLRAAGELLFGVVAERALLLDHRAEPLVVAADVA